MATKKKSRSTSTRVTKSSSKDFSPLEKVQQDLELNQSSFSLILGILIVVVLGILIFNFFNKSNNTSSTQTQTTDQNGDVTKDALPGKYTVKDGDTLFTIAQNYYGNGDDFQQIADANKLTDVNIITTGQVLDIPKLAPSPQASASPSQSPSISPSESPSPSISTQPVVGGVGGATNQTEWGEAITGNSYTVVEGDWLSKIAGRAYGDIWAYTKIAQANKIADPNVIEPGMVLTIPR